MEMTLPCTSERGMRDQQIHKGAYKLVNGLHRWVGLGLHGVEDGTTTFLSEGFNTQSVHIHWTHNHLLKHRTIKQNNTTAEHI